MWCFYLLIPCEGVNCKGVNLLQVSLTWVNTQLTLHYIPHYNANPTFFDLIGSHETPVFLPLMLQQDWHPCSGLRIQVMYTKIENVVFLLHFHLVSNRAWRTLIWQIMVDLQQLASAVYFEECWNDNRHEEGSVWVVNQSYHLLDIYPWVLLSHFLQIQESDKWPSCDWLRHTRKDISNMWHHRDDHCRKHSKNNLQ